MKKSLLAVTLFSALFIAGCSDSTANTNKNEAENEKTEEKNEVNEELDQTENEPVHSDTDNVLPTDTIIRAMKMKQC